MLNILITGGCGFIGSNMVEYVLNNDKIDKVVVLDNLSTGTYDNIKRFEDNPRLRVVIGDMRDFDVCKDACKGVDVICSLAALGSVPRSMKTPLSSHDNNVNSFANLLEAARSSGIKRVVYASSSSVYGNTKDLNDFDYCKPVSFYGLTKHVNDLYASYYSKYFGMECIGMRYHNVFGKNQSFSGEYSAVIPIFITRCLKNSDLVIHGDGSQYRDFTHVSNVIHANMLALTTDNVDAFGKSFDIGSNTKVSVLELADTIIELSDSISSKSFVASRTGDIHASFADMALSEMYISYRPLTNFTDGIKKTILKYKFS